MAISAPKRSALQTAPGPSRTTPPEPKKRPRDRPRPGGSGRSSATAPEALRKEAAPKRKPGRKAVGDSPIRKTSGSATATPKRKASPRAAATAAPARKAPRKVSTDAPKRKKASPRATTAAPARKAAPRKASTAAHTPGVAWLGDECGLDERSRNPSTPSASNRSIHLPTVFGVVLN